MPKTQPRFTTARIDLFCRMRLASVLSGHDLDQLRVWLGDCLDQRRFPPHRGKSIDAALIAEAAGIDPTASHLEASRIRAIRDAHVGKDNDSNEG